MYCKILLAIFLACFLSGCKKSCAVMPGSEDSVAIYSNKILVDASKDGGGWWFPQSPLTGFSSKAEHQGTDLVKYLVSLGYSVDELPRETVLTSDLLTKYSKIIRATGYFSYTKEELQAYDDFLNKKGNLFLVAEFLRDNESDGLAEHLGLKLKGSITGGVSVFPADTITAGVTGFYCFAGSVVTNSTKNSNITVLGSFDNSFFLDVNNDGIFNDGDLQGPPVMGKLNNFPGKVFFLGDINGIESVPQPFTQNIFEWLFKK